MENKRTVFTPGAATDEPVPSVHFATRGEADAYAAGIAEGLRRARGEPAEPPPPAPGFDPVPLRYRRDGWTPERQVGFIRAIAECGCVAEACRRVGMSAESAYELARRPDAQSFRVAWDIAMDNAVRRVGDGAFSRALNGVEIPHFYKGELVGTHRRYDERLTMFILRTRDRERFGRRLEAAEPLHTREGRALDLADMLAWVRRDAEKEQAGRPRQVVTALGASYAEQDSEEDEPPRRRNMCNVYAFAPPCPDEALDEADDEEALEAERRVQEISDEEADAHLARLEAQIRAMLAGEEEEDEDDVPAPLGGEGVAPACGGAAERPPAPDVSRTSSTSDPVPSTSGPEPSFPRKRATSAPPQPAPGGAFETGGSDEG
jgi:hypothetical protein